MVLSRPLKRVSDGELAEMCAQLVDLLDRGWIQYSTAAAAFLCKPDWSLHICYDCTVLNPITRPAVEPLAAARWHSGAALLHQARFSQQLLPAAGAARGPRTGGRRTPTPLAFQDALQLDDQRRPPQVAAAGGAGTLPG